MFNYLFSYITINECATKKWHIVLLLIPGLAFPFAILYVLADMSKSISHKWKRIKLEDF